MIVKHLYIGASCPCGYRPQTFYAPRLQHQKGKGHHNIFYTSGASTSFKYCSSIIVLRSPQHANRNGHVAHFSIGPISECYTCYRSTNTHSGSDEYNHIYLQCSGGVNGPSLLSCGNMSAHNINGYELLLLVKIKPFLTCLM